MFVNNISLGCFLFLLTGGSCTEEGHYERKLSVTKIKGNIFRALFLFFLRCFVFHSIQSLRKIYTSCFDVLSLSLSTSQNRIRSRKFPIFRSIWSTVLTTHPFRIFCFVVKTEKYFFFALSLLWNQIDSTPLCAH